MEEDKHRVQKFKFYEHPFPKEGDNVIVRCISCEENGCYVELLQYQLKRGMIPINQYTQSMKKNLHRAMKVGRVQAVRVVKVDENKGYIDLSKSKLNVEQEKAANDKFSKAKAIRSIMIHVAQAAKVEIQNLYETLVWPLYQKDLGIQPLDYLIKIIMMTKDDKINELGIENEQVKKVLVDQIKRRYKKPSLKSISKFKVSVKTFDGINEVKSILNKGVQAAKQKGFQVKIFIIGAPDYLCEVSTSNKEQGEQALYAVLNTIQKYTKQVNGTFDIKEKPRVVGDSGFKIQDLINEQLQNNKQIMEDDQDSDMGDADD